MSYSRTLPKCSVCGSHKHTKRKCPKLVAPLKVDDRSALTATLASQARTIEGLLHVVQTLGPQTARSAPCGRYHVDPEEWDDARCLGPHCKPAEMSTANVTLYRRICEDAHAFALALPAGTVIVSGGAQGVDHAVALAARRNPDRLSLIEHFPDYEQHTRTCAPLVRNLLIVADADEVHAWPAPWSRGTWHTVKAAKRAKKPVVIHDLERPGLPISTRQGQE